MSYFFIIFGVILVIASARNTQGCLFTLLQGDLFNNAGSNSCGSISGSSSFLYWLAAIFIIGAIGYDERLRPISDGFLALVIIVLLINNGGFFAKFKDALSQIAGTTATPIGNASSPGVSLAVDTIPNTTTNTTNTSTVVAGGGGVVLGGGGGGGNNGGGGCPPGYVRSAEVGDCIPDNSLDPFGFGGGGGLDGGFGGSDPFGSGGFGDESLLKLPKLPVLTTGHGVA